MRTWLYQQVVRPVARKFLRPRPRVIPDGPARGLKFAARDVSEKVFDGTYELSIQEALVDRVKAGDVFYDVGANVGFLTVLAARLVGPGGAVHAFEPVARNVETIRRNVRLNGWSNVRVHPVAVSAASGEQELLVTDYCGGASLSSAGVTVPGVVKKIVVPTVSIDDFVRQGKAAPPSVVKVDVEGAEVDVLRGMEHTLRAHRPVLLYEVDDADEAVMRRRWAELDNFVAAAGYRATRVEHVYPGGGWQVGHTVALPL